MDLFHYPLPEPYWNLSIHTAFQSLFPRMMRLVFLHERFHGTDDKPPVFCVVEQPSVSSIQAFVFFLDSSDQPTSEYGELPRALLRRKVHSDPQELA